MSYSNTDSMRVATNLEGLRQKTTSSADADHAKTKIEEGRESFFNQFMGRYGLTAKSSLDWDIPVSEQDAAAAYDLSNMSLSEMNELSTRLFGVGAIGRNETSMLQFQFAKLPFAKEEGFLSSPLANLGDLFGASGNFFDVSNSHTLDWISEYTDQLTHLVENEGSMDAIGSTKRALSALRGLQAQESLFKALDISRNKDQDRKSVV